MEIVLISDGPLPMESPVRRLPLFFHARLIDMDKVSPGTVGEGKIAIVELLDATDAGLIALKAAWGSIAAIPVICFVARKNRREVIQAGALGKSEMLDRETPLALILRRLTSLTQKDIAEDLPARMPQKTVEAYKKGNVFLENMCLASAEGTKIPVSVLKTSASEIFNAMLQEGLSFWMEAVNSHHSPTYSHSLKVAGLAGMFANHLGWSKGECEEVVAGGLVHDIGKTRIPLSILDKADKLTEKERAIIDKHPSYGREILKPRLELPIDIKKMAIQHHEYLDGTGYPDGLKGERISLKVRLITICDIFTALTEERAYKEGLPARTAISMLQDMGPKLDQKMVSAFARMLLDNGFGALNRSEQKVRRGSAA